MYVQKNIYITFYDILFATVKEKEAIVKPGSARKATSPLYWDEIGDKKFTELIGGGGANKARHYYRKLSDVKKLDGIDIDDIAFAKALKYIGIKIPDETLLGRTLNLEEETKFLYEQFRNEYFKKSTESNESVNPYITEHLRLLLGQSFACFFHDFFEKKPQFEKEFWFLNQGIISFKVEENNNLNVNLQLEKGSDSDSDIVLFSGFTELKDSVDFHIIVKLFSEDSTLFLFLTNPISDKQRKFDDEIFYGQYIRLTPTSSITGGFVLQKDNTLDFDVIPKTYTIKLEPIKEKNTSNIHYRNSNFIDYFESKYHSKIIEFLERIDMNRREVKIKAKIDLKPRTSININDTIHKVFNANL